MIVAFANVLTQCTQRIKVWTKPVWAVAWGPFLASNISTICPLDFILARSLTNELCPNLQPLRRSDYSVCTKYLFDPQIYNSWNFSHRSKLTKNIWTYGLLRTLKSHSQLREYVSCVHIAFWPQPTWFSWFLRYLGRKKQRWNVWNPFVKLESTHPCNCVRCARTIPSHLDDRFDCLVRRPNMAEHNVFGLKRHEDQQQTRNSLRPGPDLIQHNLTNWQTPHIRALDNTGGNSMPSFGSSLAAGKLRRYFCDRCKYIEHSFIVAGPRNWLQFRGWSNDIGLINPGGFRMYRHDSKSSSLQSFLCKTKHQIPDLTACRGRIKRH